MDQKLAAELTRMIEQFPENGEELDAATLAALAGTVARMFGVDADEVAVLLLEPKRKILRFVLPDKLRAVGTIPLSSTVALAAKTAREKRGEVNNTFATARHASVFEGVPLGRREGEMIHKIMSAPVTHEGKVIGVVQISRKGRTPVESGPDFSQRELRELMAISDVLGEFLARVPVS